MIRHVKKLFHWIWRNSMSGRFVSRKYAEKHGDTTERERV